MKTALAVGDGKLDNDEMGILFRRVTEIAKRIDAGSITKKDVFNALLAIVEGKASSMLTPCQRPHRSKHVKFVTPSEEERKKSLAPVVMRLPQYVNRLYFYDTLRTLYPGKQYPEKHAEDIMAEMWEAENIPVSMVNFGKVPVQSILNESRPSERDCMIVASTLQWLGTNVGSCFLSRFIAATDMQI